MVTKDDKKGWKMWCPFPFWWVDSGLIFKIKSVSGYKVLIALLRHRNIKTGACFCSYSRIAKVAKISRASAIRGVRELEASGIIRRTGPGKYRSNTYDILLSFQDSVRADTTDDSCNDIKTVSIPDTSLGISPDSLKIDPLNTEREREINRKNSCSVLFKAASQLLDQAGRITPDLIDIVTGSIQTEIHDPRRFAEQILDDAYVQVSHMNGKVRNRIRYVAKILKNRIELLGEYYSVEGHTHGIYSEK